MECEGNAGEMAVLDLRHCNLSSVPTDVFKAEPNLEEIYLDANQIRELPRVLKKFKLIYFFFDLAFAILTLLRAVRWYLKSF